MQEFKYYTKIQISENNMIRIPKSLHYQLSIEAEQKGVSLNQYALYKLTK